MSENLKLSEKYMMTGSCIQALIYFGLWPSNVKDYPILNKVHVWLSKLSVFTFMTFFTSMIIQIPLIYNDIYQLMYNLSILLLYTITFAKISILIFKREEVSIIIAKTKKFQDDVMMGWRRQNIQILFRHSRIVKFMSIFLWLMVIAVCLLLVTPGFLAIFDINNKVEEDGTIIKTLPFSCYLPFDQQRYHVAAFFTQIIICIPGTAYVAIWDTFFFSLMVAAICEIKVLQNLLITLGHNKDKSVYQSVVECVQLHQEIIQYTTDLDSIVSNVFFLDFVTYAVLLCSIGFRALFDDNADIPIFVSCTAYLLAVLYQLFMFYWTGNLIMEESMEIASAAWKSDWYQFDKSIVKSLIIIIMRSHKPLKISVGRFYNMNLATLVVILRAWYSYMTLLNQMKEN